MKKSMLLYIVFYSTTLNASHDFIMGTGATSQGLAGTGVADSGEPSLIFTNPSAIASGENKRLSLSIIAGSQDLRINNRPFDKNDYIILEGGFIIPFSLMLKDLYFGLSLTFPQPYIMYLYSQDPSYPQFINYRNMLRYSIKPALGWRVYNRFSLGIGFDIFGASSGKASIEIDLANQKTRRSDFIMDQRFTYTPIIGAQYHFSEVAVVGFSYRFENHFDLSIDTNFDMQLMSMNVLEEGVSFFVPAEIMLGIKTIPKKGINLLLDVGYLFFSDMPPQYLYVNIEPSVLLPSVDGLAQRETYKISAKDVLRVRGGLSYSILDNRIVLRGGYQYFPTPIPDQIYNTNILDSDRHIFAVGSGFHLSSLSDALKQGLDINIYLQYHYLTSRKFNKADPLDPYGDYSIKGGILEGGLGISCSL